MLGKSSLLGLAALTTLVSAAPSFVAPRALSFDYNNEKVRGVNLGGWLVAEPWITPSLFENAGYSAVDEWTLGAALGSSGPSVMNAHWSSWITQSDIQQIAGAGLNHLRIPIGYWSVIPISGEPYVYGALAYMDKAIGWARSAGLRVEIDLHGAPGSQNGFDNSGHKGAVGWGTGNTVNQTLAVIKALADRYAGDTDVVTIINLMNEPLVPPIALSTLQAYYINGYGEIRADNPDTVVNFNDAFLGIPPWDSFVAPLHNVMLGVHYYQVFDVAQLAETIDEHVADACGAIPLLEASPVWVTVSEWSGALTDCAKYLNGRYVGARYDGTYGDGSYYIGSCAPFASASVASLSQTNKTNLRRYIEAQLDAYEAKTGWFYWTWKTSGAPEWDMQAQLAAGVFPQPLTSREYPGQCS